MSPEDELKPDDFDFNDEPEFDSEANCPFCEGEGCEDCDWTGEYQ